MKFGKIEMKIIGLVIAVIGLSACGGGSSGAVKVVNPVTAAPVISSPSGFSVSFNLEGSVVVGWNKRLGESYNLYISSDKNFEIENYSIYDNSSLEINVTPPFIFNIEEPAESYTFKIVARNKNTSSDALAVSAYTRFSISSSDPSVYVDAKQGLDVRRCSEGQQYDALAEVCTGTAALYTPSELSLHLASLDNEWRLPTTEEINELSPCPLMSSGNTNCVPNNQSSVIMELFLGSGIANYYDITAIKPYSQDGKRWHRSHGFPSEYGYSSVNYGSNPEMHAVLVRNR